MKPIILLIIFSINSIFGYSQILTEDFEQYNQVINNKWKTEGIFEFLDDSISSKHITSKNSFSLIYKDSKSDVGKIELKTLVNGFGNWQVTISKGNTNEFDKDSNWKELDKVDISNTLDNYTTITLDFNSIESVFVKITFTPLGGNSTISVDDIVFKYITTEAKESLQHQQKLALDKENRQKEIKAFIQNKSFNDAKLLLEIYEKDYKKRIKALTMLSRKSNATKLISGTATTLGSYNQLSNPLNYNKFKEFKKRLFECLDPIDTLYFSDEIEGKVNNFYKKIEDPINIVASIGDVFTGGAVSKLVDGFKNLITKGFSTERLSSKFKPRDIEDKKKKGIELYLESKSFFEEIEQQNQGTLGLNYKVLDIYKKVANFNDKIDAELNNGLELSNIRIEKDILTTIIKNENQDSLDIRITNSFSMLLGNSDTYNVNDITNYVKRLDGFFVKVDDLIKDYKKISNSLNSYYIDFNETLNKGCPYTNLDSNDKKYWNANTDKLLKITKNLQKDFEAYYIGVEFIEE